MTLKRIAVEFGMGTDLHGKDYTKAACRGLRDALWHNSLTVCHALGYELDEMQVHIEIGVAEPDRVDTSAVADILPYGNASVAVCKGGLDIDNAEYGITVIANVAAIVSLDIDEASDIDGISVTDQDEQNR